MTNGLPRYLGKAKVVVLAQENMISSIRAKISNTNRLTSLKKLRTTARVNLDLTDDKGKTALMQSIANGNVEFASILIQEGADVNIKDNVGVTALMYSVTFGLPDVTLALIHRKADVNARDKHGISVLQLAQYSGRLEMLLILKNAGAKE